MRMEPVSDFAFEVYMVGSNNTNPLSSRSHLELRDAAILNSSTIKVTHQNWADSNNQFFSFTLTFIVAHLAQLPLVYYSGGSAQPASLINS